MNGLRKLLITYAEGNAAGQMAEYSIPSFKAYAELHGYDFKPIERYNDQHPAWQKVYAFQEYLKNYDVVLWIDIDAIILRFDKDISSVFDETVAFQALAVEPDKPNCGVWLMRSCEQSFKFLDYLIDISGSFQTPCWEQDAVRLLLGYYELDYSRNTILLKEKWNNIHNSVPPEESIIVHFAGRSDQDKIEGLREIAEAGVLI